MNAVRVSGFAGLGMAAMLAIWWVATVQASLDQGQDLQGPSLLLLDALWLTRLMVILLLAPVLASLPALLAIAWYALPLVVLGYAASGADGRRLLLGEALLVAVAVVLSLAMQSISRHRGKPVPEPLAWTVGICLASLAWAWRAELRSLWLP